MKTPPGSTSTVLANHSWKVCRCVLCECLRTMVPSSVHRLHSNLPSPFVFFFLSRSARPHKLGTKIGKVPSLPPVSVKADNFGTYLSRGPFLRSVTDPAAVASDISAVSLADCILLEVRSRLAPASSSLQASHSQTPVTTRPVSRMGKLQPLIEQ